MPNFEVVVKEVPFFHPHALVHIPSVSGCFAIEERKFALYFAL